MSLATERSEPLALRRRWILCVYRTRPMTQGARANGTTHRKAILHRAFSHSQSTVRYRREREAAGNQDAGHMGARCCQSRKAFESDLGQSGKMASVDPTDARCRNVVLTRPAACGAVKYEKRIMPPGQVQRLVRPACQPTIDSDAWSA
jgi:hypothetical protein